MIGEVGIIASANSRSKWSWWGRDAVTKPPAYGWPLMVHVEEATERREGRGLIEMKLMDTPVVTADRVMKSVVFWRENLGETTSWADMSVPMMLKLAAMSLRGDGYFPGGRKSCHKRDKGAHRRKM
jgi:hypothetical protein